MAEVEFKDWFVVIGDIIVTSNNLSWVPLALSLTLIFLETIAAHDLSDVDSHISDGTETLSAHEFGSVGIRALS
jgi:hypothetical protein